MIPTDPNTTVSTLSMLYHSGAWACLGILVAFLGLKWASQHVAWLEAPGRAHYIAILLGALGVVAAPAAQGTTPNLAMIVSAISGAVMLLLPGAATPTASKAPNAGSVRLTVLAVLALVGVVLTASLSSCSAAQRAAGQQALACVESAAVKDLEPTVTTILESGGSSWEQQLESLSIGLGIDTVTCAVQYVRDLWAIHEGSGSAVAATLDPKLVRAQQWLAKHGAK